MSNVNTKYRHCFVHVPKTGGTSMERRPFVGGSGHQSLERMEKPAGFFRWGWVRHPAERLVSTYHGLIQHNAKRIKRPMPFDEFVRKVPEGQPIPGCKLHIEPQVTYLCKWPEKTRILAHWWGRFENMEQDWRYLCACLRVKYEPLPHLNKSKHKPWQELYTAETLAIVERHYAKDYDVFKYRRGLR